MPLELSGVGIRQATLDGDGAPLGFNAEGRLGLFAEGKGRHELALEMVAPLETTAARQVLSFKLPRPSSARMRLSVPGDVEVKSGAEVISREVDEAAGVTRFELLPQQGDAQLVMTLNSRRVEANKSSLDVGIGINVGQVSYGNIGSPGRLDFTVLGGAVNVASRIEGLTKSIGHRVLVTSAIAGTSPDLFLPCGVHEVRGLANPIELFSLIEG